MAHVLNPIKKSMVGELEVPGDKSISHRAIIFGAIARGTTSIEHFLDGEDCMRTIDAFREIGVPIYKHGTTVEVVGTGISNLKEPTKPIYFGNSGTTARLLIGLLAGLPFFTTVYGDSSLSNRPMNRVVQPLLEMGAYIEGRTNGQYLPLAIKGAPLKGIEYTLQVKSAQVKSALLLAGLTADGEMTIIENTPTRNHTENMLRDFGADISIKGPRITVTGKNNLQATSVYVPGDISSAAFFIVAALIVPNSEITIRNVGLNPTRTGILEILKQMDASIEITNQQIKAGEVLGDIIVRSSNTKGTIIEGDIIPSLIDEIPIIALLATQSDGTTIIRNAEELRVKETDRISATVDVLTSLGATVEATEDGMIIQGKSSLNGGTVKSYHDHRMAMMATIASLVTKEPVVIDEISSINISYPSFFSHLQKLSIEFH